MSADSEENEQTPVEPRGKRDWRKPFRFLEGVEATTWMALLGAVAVAFGGAIAWRREEAGTVLVIGAILLGLGTIGKQIVGLRGKWKKFEIGLEMVKEDVEDADSLLDQRREIIETNPESELEVRAVEAKLEEKIDRIRETLGRLSIEDRPLLMGMGTGKIRAHFLAQELPHRMVAFHEKAGDGKVRLHLLSGDGLPLRGCIVRVIAEDGQLVGRVARWERTMGATVVFPDEFTADETPKPGRYRVRWTVRNKEGTERKPYTVADDGFTYP